LAKSKGLQGKEYGTNKMMNSILKLLNLTQSGNYVNARP